jgi:hypothetical protein
MIMGTSTTLLIATVIFIIVVVVVAIFFYLLGVARGTSGKGKTAARSDPNLIETARLMRNIDTQELVVQMDGQTKNKAGELLPEQQSQLKVTSSMLADWLGQPPPAQAEGDQPTVPIPEQPRQESEQIPIDTLAVKTQSSLVSILPALEVRPVSTKLTDMVGSILKPTPVKVPVFMSIAMQINAILQARIAGTPFARRGLSLSDAPDHGVLVTLDGGKYPGISDVPDEEVRDLIRSVVAEWEAQSKAGTI